MSEQTFTLNIVSAEEEIFSGEVRFAVMPAQDGEMGIYPQHTPVLTIIKPGVVQYRVSEDAPFEVIYVSGGILEVQPKVVTVLADTALRGSDLDDAKAELAIKQAQEKIAKSGEGIDYAKAQVELAEAVAQQEALRKLRKSQSISTKY